MKKRNITLLTAFAAAAALAPAAPAAVGMSSVLRSTDGGSTYTTTDQGTDASDPEYALGHFDTTDTNAYVADATPYFRNKAGDNSGYLASDILVGADTGFDASFLAGAQYVAVDSDDKLVTYAMYEITFDQPGTFYLLADFRDTGFAPTGYTDTGVNIHHSQYRMLSLMCGPKMW